MSNLSPQVLFIVSVVLHEFIQNSWEMISDDAESLASLLITIINENYSIVDQPHISKLILILCNIFLLNFNLFSFISEINQSLLPYVFSNLYEIFNTEKPFLMKWDIFSISRENLQNQFSNCIELLNQFDPDSEWLELHYQLLYFRLNLSFYDSNFSYCNSDFSNFIPFLEKIQTATTIAQNSDNLLKLFNLILSIDMTDSSSEDQIYFSSIIEIVISLSNSIIENENISDDNYYDYVIYLWDVIFNINDFFYECNHFDLLDEIASEYLKSVTPLIRHSMTFTDSLYNFSDFLKSNNQSESLIPLVVSYLDFLSALVNSDDFFRDLEIVNCFECIQKGFEECLFNYISSIIEQNQLPESFFLILASTEPNFSRNFAEFASNSLIQIMKENSPSISPPTALFFIRKTGVFAESEAILSNLVSIAIELFDSDSNGAAKCIIDISRSVPGVLSHFASQIMSISSSGKLKVNESCTLVVSLYIILPSLVEQSEAEGSPDPGEILAFIISFVEHYLKEVVSLFDENQNSTIALDSLNDCLYFISTFLENTPTIVPTEFKSSFYEVVSSSLKPLFLIEDEIAQDELSKIFTLFFQLDYSTNNDSETIISFVENQFQRQNEAAIIDCIIHKLFEKERAVFWETFSEQFLASLLTMDSNIIALNNSLDLFEEIFSDIDSCQRISNDFAVLTLHSLFESMIGFYLPRQIKSGLKIVHSIIRNKFLPCETVVSVFLEFFDMRIEGVEELVSRFSSQNNDEEGFDLDGEFELIYSAINYIKEQNQ